jgi:hypothetical protein
MGIQSLISRTGIGSRVALLAAILVSAGCGGASSRSTAAHTASESPTRGRQLLETTASAGSAKLQGECGRAARRAGFPIACPAALPFGSTSFWANGFGGGNDCAPSASGDVRLTRWTWVGTYFRHLGHFDVLVVASVPHIVTPQAFVYLIRTTRPHRSRSVVVAGTILVDGHQARFVHPSLNRALDPPPQNGGVIYMGQTVLIWTQHGHTYAVGVGGRGISAKTREIAIADRLVFVNRASGRSSS